MHISKVFLLFFIGLILIQCASNPSSYGPVRRYPIQEAWSGNSINAVIFRKNSVVTHDNQQYVAFYDSSGSVILAKRELGSPDWDIRKTEYEGNIYDAHNSISIMVDGDGYLHMAWNHHDTPLSYCRSKTPGSLELSAPLGMTGINEDKVSYPEFYRLPDGNVIFMYRDGSSGRGNMMINFYETSTKTWTQRQDGLVSGEGRRNAYWQTAIDHNGIIHLSWVWRETWDVSTNHDLCYAKSADNGITWQKSTGENYKLPITLKTSEYIWRIPQMSELINQTSMCTDTQGHPVIATYWLPEGTEVPQYQVVFHDGEKWRKTQVSGRKTPFSLSGGGTKRIPISRPQVMADQARIYMLFRDEERKNRVSLAVCSDLKDPVWKIINLSKESVGQWEPTYDSELWIRKHELHVFVQHVGQGDAETVVNIEPQMAEILEWKWQE